MAALAGPAGNRHVTADRVRAPIRATCFQSGVHLAEGQLDPPTGDCPLCLSKAPRSAVFGLQANPEVELLACKSCGGYSASRMPTPETLRGCYRDYYGEKDERFTFDLPERLALRVLRRAFPAVSKKRFELLDFGGGDAEITRRIAARLLERGADRVHILLVDYNTQLRPPDSSRISLERVDTLEEVAKGAFDLVVASAILEHIPRPRPELMRLLQALSPGGVFYARTPCVVPLAMLCRRLGLRWDFTFPWHVHDLGQDFWSTILSHLPLEDPIAVLDARPAIVETTFGNHPLRTIAAYLLKAPWHVLGRSYRWIGGFEVFLRRGDRR